MFNNKINLCILVTILSVSCAPDDEAKNNAGYVVRTHFSLSTKNITLKTEVNGTAQQATLAGCGADKGWKYMIYLTFTKDSQKSVCFFPTEYCEDDDEDKKTDRANASLNALLDKTTANCDAIFSALGLTRLLVI
jgi:hypothetical protein